MKRGCWLTVIALLLALASVALIGLVARASGGAQAWLMLRAELASGQAAADLYRELIGLRGPDYELYMRLGESLADAGEDEQAIEAWEMAAQSDPTAVKPFLKIAKLSLDRGDNETAESGVQRALDRDPESWRAHHLGGLAAAERGEHTLAVVRLERALELGAPENRVCYPLGRAWEELGDMDAAVEAYDRGAGSCDSRCKERLRELRAEGVVDEAPETGEEAEVAPRYEDTEQDYEYEESDMEPMAGAALAMAMMVLYVGFFGVIMIVTWGAWLAAALAIYDCSQRDFPNATTRAAWCLLLFVAHFIGAVVYYFVIYRPDTPPRIA